MSDDGDNVVSRIVDEIHKQVSKHWRADKIDVGFEIRQARDEASSLINRLERQLQKACPEHEWEAVHLLFLCRSSACPIAEEIKGVPPSRLHAQEGRVWITEEFFRAYKFMIALRD